jgi:hypothetical protein
MAFKEIDDGYPHAKILGFAYRCFRTSSPMSGFFPGTVFSKTPEEDCHIVPTAYSHKQRAFYPGPM